MEPHFQTFCEKNFIQVHYKVERLELFLRENVKTVKAKKKSPPHPAKKAGLWWGVNPRSCTYLDLKDIHSVWQTLRVFFLWEHSLNSVALWAFCLNKTKHSVKIKQKKCHIKIVTSKSGEKNTNCTVHTVRGLHSPSTC